MDYNPLIKTLDDYGGEELILEWGNGLKIIGKPDTLYETDNGLEDDDINYVEYYAVAFRVENIISSPNKESRVYDWLIGEERSLVEISLYDDPPNAVYLANGQKLWELSLEE
ncbi:hypothetical protein UP15_17755 [Bacillus pumilus]|uniref:hypothetical protein n=1 Tax=Bacillus TaxID=1386 RepID=UPI000418B9FC|nr:MULTISPECIES: hypothetical protein [Bacillus]AMM90722.1 hypothetical protein UP15_17755 [Bacillus pumilus]MBW3698736.1 hypothetical protein [Bacillus aerophilus]MDH8709280.1 hypothetical protein [Micromonospora sp. 1209]NQW97242.1 hypothetical protein [Bacillus stratosphericus]AKC67731.1 hypothetical protein VT48_17370 [Bacillus altitudinis]